MQASLESLVQLSIQKYQTYCIFPKQIILIIIQTLNISKLNMFYFRYEMKIEMIPYIQEDVKLFIAHFQKILSKIQRAAVSQTPLYDQYSSVQKNQSLDSLKGKMFNCLIKKIAAIDRFYDKYYFDFRAHLIFRSRNLLTQFWKQNSRLLTTSLRDQNYQKQEYGFSVASAANQLDPQKKDKSKNAKQSFIQQQHINHRQKKIKTEISKQFKVQIPKQLKSDIFKQKPKKSVKKSLIQQSSLSKQKKPQRGSIQISSKSKSKNKITMKNSDKIKISDKGDEKVKKSPKKTQMGSNKVQSKLKTQNQMKTNKKIKKEDQIKKMTKQQYIAYLKGREK